MDPSTVNSTSFRFYNTIHFYLRYYYSQFSLLFFFLFNMALLFFTFQPIAFVEGYFGRNCSRVYSLNCKHDTCRHTDGWRICTPGLMYITYIFLKKKIIELFCYYFRFQVLQNSSTTALSDLSTKEM